MTPAVALRPVDPKKKRGRRRPAAVYIPYTPSYYYYPPCAPIIAMGNCAEEWPASTWEAPFPDIVTPRSIIDSMVMY